MKLDFETRKSEGYTLYRLVQACFVVVSGACRIGRDFDVRLKALAKKMIWAWWRIRGIGEDAQEEAFVELLESTIGMESWPKIDRSEKTNLVKFLEQMHRIATGAAVREDATVIVEQNSLVAYAALDMNGEPYIIIADWYVEEFLFFLCFGYSVLVGGPGYLTTVGVGCCSAAMRWSRRVLSENVIMDGDCNPESRLRVLDSYMLGGNWSGAWIKYKALFEARMDMLKYQMPFSMDVYNLPELI